MKLSTWTFVTLLLTSLLLTERAEAKNLQGHLGLGLEQSISGISGMTVRYWSGDRVGIHATLGGGLSAGVGENQDQVGSSLGLSAGMVYNVARSLHANLGVGVRAAIAMRNEALRNALSSSTGDTREGDDLQFNIELPIVIEYFLSESFSVSVSTGILLAFIPAEGAVVTPKGNGGESVPKTIGVGIGAGSITGSLGAVYYF